MYLGPDDTLETTPVDVLMNQLNLYDDIVSNRRYQSNQEFNLAWLLHQNLMRIEVLNFDGSGLVWAEFIIKFKDIFHDRATVIVIKNYTTCSSM